MHQYKKEKRSLRPLFISFSPKETPPNVLTAYTDIYSKLLGAMKQKVCEDWVKVAYGPYNTLLSLNVAQVFHARGILKTFGPRDTLIAAQITQAVKECECEEKLLILYHNWNDEDNIQIDVVSKSDFDLLRLKFGLIHNTTNISYYYRTDETETNLVPVFIGDVITDSDDCDIWVGECELSKDTATEIHYSMLVDGDYSNVDSAIADCANGCRVVSRNQKTKTTIQMPPGYGIDHVEVVEREGVKKVEKSLKFHLQHDLMCPGLYMLEFTPTNAKTYVTIRSVKLYNTIFQLKKNNGVIFSTMDDASTISVLFALNPDICYESRDQLDPGYFSLSMNGRLCESGRLSHRLPIKKVEIVDSKNHPYLAIHLDRKGAEEIIRSEISRDEWAWLRFVMHPGALRIYMEGENMASLEKTPMWSDGRFFSVGIPGSFLDHPNGFIVVRPELQQPMQHKPARPITIHPDYESIPVFDYRYPQVKSIFLDNQDEDNLSVTWTLDNHIGELRSTITIADPEKCAPPEKICHNKRVWCRFFYSEEIKNLLDPKKFVALDQPAGKNVVVIAYDRTKRSTSEGFLPCLIPVEIVQAYYYEPKSLKEELQLTGVVVGLNPESLLEAKKEGCNTLQFTFLEGFITETPEHNKDYKSKQFTVQYDLENGLPVRYNLPMVGSEEPLEVKNLSFNKCQAAISTRLSAPQLCGYPDKVRIMFTLELRGMPGATLDFSGITINDFKLACDLSDQGKECSCVSDLEITEYKQDSFRNQQVCDTRNTTVVYRFSILVNRNCWLSMCKKPGSTLTLTIPEKTVILTQEQLVNPTGIKEIDIKRWYINGQMIEW